jgi:hypothetical protein
MEGQIIRVEIEYNNLKMKINTKKQDNKTIQKLQKKTKNNFNKEERKI